MTEEKRKIGIFGGTFNPIHSGHVNYVRQYMQAMPDSEILVIPTNIPPHKIALDLASDEDRLNMCRIAFEGMDRVSISDMEILRDGLSYTVDTLTILKEQMPDSELYLIIGSDMLDTFLTWYRPLDILSMATLCCAARQQDIDEKMAEKIAEIKSVGGEVINLDIDVMEVSSTQIRTCIKNGENIEGIIPQGVYDYIMSHGLYGADSLKSDAWQSESDADY